jgi:hypothetical protein
MTTITSILTEDILPKIFQFLSNMEIGRFSQTSKAAQKAICAITQETRREIDRPLQGRVGAGFNLPFDLSTQRFSSSGQMLEHYLGQMHDWPRPSTLTDEQLIMQGQRDTLLRILYANLTPTPNALPAPRDDDNS